MSNFTDLDRIKGRMMWAKDLLDARDFIFPHLPPTTNATVDLRPHDSPIVDQGDLGSCTANAIAAAFEFDLRKQGLSIFAPSRLFIYYNERVLEGDVMYDNGAYIRDGIKSIGTIGVCSETLWPYVENKFATLPPRNCYTAALSNKGILYQRVTQTLDQMKAVLNSGFPFTIGFTVYQSFLNAGSNGGFVPMPNPREPILGGHAVVVVGYKDSTQMFIVRNSWGTSWGAAGYFYVPYAYFTNTTLASDLWVIQSVS